MEIKGKGEFKAFSKTFSTWEGDQCDLTLYADGRMETINRCWSGFKCEYEGGENKWTVPEEKVRGLVELLSGEGVLAEQGTGAPQEEKGKDISESVSVETSQGVYVLAPGAKYDERGGKALSFVHELYEWAEANTPRDRGPLEIPGKRGFIEIKVGHYDNDGGCGIRLSIDPEGEKGKEGILVVSCNSYEGFGCAYLNGSSYDSGGRFETGQDKLVELAGILSKEGALLEKGDEKDGFIHDDSFVITGKGTYSLSPEAREKSLEFLEMLYAGQEKGFKALPENEVKGKGFFRLIELGMEDEDYRPCMIKLFADGSMETCNRLKEGSCGHEKGIINWAADEGKAKGLAELLSKPGSLEAQDFEPPYDEDKAAEKGFLLTTRGVYRLTKKGMNEAKEFLDNALKGAEKPEEN